MGPNLLEAYREYLENLYERSQDLVQVELDSVPEGVNCSLTWLEWGDFV